MYDSMILYKSVSIMYFNDPSSIFMKDSGIHLFHTHMDNLKMIAGILDDVTDGSQKGEKLRKDFTFPIIGYFYFLRIVKQIKLDVVDLFFINSNGQNFFSEVLTLDHGLKGNHQHLADAAV